MYVQLCAIIFHRMWIKGGQVSIAVREESRLDLWSLNGL